MTAPSLTEPAPVEATVAGSATSNPFVSIPRPMVLAILFLGAFYTLAVMVLGLSNASQSRTSMVWVTLSSVWLIFWTFYPFIRLKPDYGWCHPLIIAALLGIANLVLRSTGLFVNGLDDHIMLPDKWPEELDMIFAYGNIVNSFALIATYLGFSRGPRFPLPPLHPPTLAPRRLYVILLACFGISLVAVYLYSRIYGGFYSCLKSLAFGMAKKIEFADDDVEGIGQYVVLMRMATVVAVVWVCSRANAFRSPTFWVITLAALGMAYLSEGKRSHMIYPALLIVLCWMMRNRKVPYLRLAVMAVFAFLLLGFLGIFRGSNWSNNDALDLSFIRDTSLAEMSEKSQEELVKRVGSESTFYPILAKVPQQEPLLYGKSYLGWALRFVPREFWPDKPRGVDVLANQTFYGGDWGMPAGPVGEAYWNFHLPGVLIIFFLFGMFKRWFVDLLLRHPDAPGIMAVYMLSIFYFDASENGFRAWLYAILPVLPMLWLGGLLHQKQTPTRRVCVGLPRPSHVS